MIEDTRDPGIETDECIDCGDDCPVLLGRCAECRRDHDDFEAEVRLASYRKVRARWAV